jgi:cadmium resistance protein CadD (predicted permease)
VANLAGLLGPIGVGIAAFVATNIDDLLVLLLFFGQVNRRFRPHHIVTGAYCGFAALVGVSLVGALGGLALPSSWIRWLGILPIGLGLKQLMEPKPEDIGEDIPEKLIHPQFYQVALVTFANGGDNIGIYVPLFATSNIVTLEIILTVFFIAHGAWCYGAYRFSRQPQIARVLTQYGQKSVPFLLIGLGGFILWKSR